MKNIFGYTFADRANTTNFNILVFQIKDLRDETHRNNLGTNTVLFELAKIHIRVRDIHSVLSHTSIRLHRHNQIIQTGITVWQSLKNDDCGDVLPGAGFSSNEIV